MEVPHCDITYDVTAPFNDVMLANKMMWFGCSTSEVHPPKMWVEPTVKLPCSRRGYHKMYIVSVTPYIPRVDGAKISLVGACELFCN